NSLTSRYRHGALLCVHQVELAPPRLSLIPGALPPDVRSFDLPFPTRPRSPAHFYLAVFLISPGPLPSLRRQIFSAAIPLEWLKVRRFLPLPAWTMSFRFHSRQASETAAHLRLCVPDSVFVRRQPAMVTTASPVVSCFLILRSFSLRNRNSPSPLCFAVQA